MDQNNSCVVQVFVGYLSSLKRTMETGKGHQEMTRTQALHAQIARLEVENKYDENFKTGFITMIHDVDFASVTWDDGTQTTDEPIRQLQYSYAPDVKIHTVNVEVDRWQQEWKWAAFPEGDYAPGRPVGFGHSESEAIVDLLDTIEK